MPTSSRPSSPSWRTRLGSTSKRSGTVRCAIPRRRRPRHPSEDRSPRMASEPSAALQELIEGGGGLVHSAGPRFFHFVNGGTTPAALGADWLTSTWDQNPGAWVATPLGGHLESVALGWLKELFGLPQSWGGVLTTGATMANFTALACARRWWGLRQGVDVDVDGLGGLPPMPVFGSGYVHPSDTKALAMLGLGRDAVRKLTADGVGRLDLAALERELEALGDAPAVVIASAGEVNAGDFDPLVAMADLAERYGAWFHVDGAFGLFAALSDRSRHLVEGVERADSVIADGHKWLNVPYDCGFAFVKDVGAAGTRSSRRARRISPTRSGRSRPGGSWARDVSTGEGVHRVGDPSRLRAKWLPGDRREPPRPGATPRSARRRGAGPRATGGREPEHRLLPLPPAGLSPRIDWTS